MPRAFVNWPGSKRRWTGSASNCHRHLGEDPDLTAVVSHPDLLPQIFRGHVIEGFFHFDVAVTFDGERWSTLIRV